MADSQNTYQNDVKISGSSNGIVKTILVLAIAGLVGFLGYNYHTNAVENAYDDGYDKAYEEGYDDGYKVAYKIAYDKGYDEGSEEADSVSYDKGYNAGYEKGYNAGYNTGYDKGKSVSSSNSSSSSSSSSTKSNSSSSSNPKTYNYILNKNTDKFHYSWCPSVKQMKEKNKIYFTGTRTEAINKGYAPCKNCNP